MMRIVSHLLMIVLSIIVVWSLLGISIKQVGEETQYSFFIKAEPTAKLLYR